VGCALRTGAIQALGRHGLSGAQPFAWEGDRIVFTASLGDSTNVWQVGISEKTFQLEGTPQRLTFGAGLDARPSMAAGGRLVFSSLASTLDLWKLPIEANQGRATGKLEALTQDAADDRLPNLSADGKKLVFISTRSGNADLWLKDLDSGKETALTATPWQESFPVISRDGRQVAYRVVQNQKSAIFSLATTGGVAETLCEDCGWPADWSWDRSKILLQYQHNAPQSTLALLSLPSGAKAEILKHPQYNLYRAHFSPDEQWVVFHADHVRGFTRKFIVPFRGAAAPEESEWIAVTDGQAFDDAPRWSPDGNLLYYLSDRDGFRCIWAQRLGAASKKPLGQPFAVSHLHSRRRSPTNVFLPWLDMCVARDKIVLNMGELTGNIWMAQLEERK